jgi:hypothetical protein
MKIDTDGFDTEPGALNTCEKGADGVWRKKFKAAVAEHMDRGVVPPPTLTFNKDVVFDTPEEQELAEKYLAKANALLAEQWQKDLPELMSRIIYGDLKFPL